VSPLLVRPGALLFSRFKLSEAGAEGSVFARGNSERFGGRSYCSGSSTGIVVGLGVRGRQPITVDSSTALMTVEMRKRSWGFGEARRGLLGRSGSFPADGSLLLVPVLLQLMGLAMSVCARQDSCMGLSIRPVLADGG